MNHPILCPIETSIGRPCAKLQLRRQGSKGGGPTCGTCHAYNRSAPGARCGNACYDSKDFCATHAHPLRRRKRAYDDDAASACSTDYLSRQESDADRDGAGGGASRTKVVIGRRLRQRRLERACLAPTLPARELRVRKAAEGSTGAGAGAGASASASAGASSPGPQQAPIEGTFEKVKILEFVDGEWRASGKGRLCLEPSSFACGGMRMAFHAQLAQDDGEEESVRKVIKIGIEPEENDRTTVEGEAEASFRARYYAELYNGYSFSKRVEFLPVTILQLIERRGPYNFATMEQDLSEEGSYYKWNDNDGEVSTSERRTPEAFSHFTLEVSDNTEICVDIQGVVSRRGPSDEVYQFTDPQIHSVEGGQFGVGNCMQDGIDLWRGRHRCNHLCRELRDSFLAEGRSWTLYDPDDDYYACAPGECEHAAEDDDDDE